MLSCVLAIICGFIVLVIDRISKLFILNNFELGECFVAIKGVLNIVFVKNPGAAWGMFGGKTLPLIILTSLVMAACVFVLIKIGKKNPLLFWSLVLVVSGGFGNLIDRIFYNGYVVDFLQFGFWTSYPVFNIADCAVVIGGGMLILYFILDLIKDFNLKKNIKSEKLLESDNGDN